MDAETLLLLRLMLQLMDSYSTQPVHSNTAL